MPPMSLEVGPPVRARFVGWRRPSLFAFALGALVASGCSRASREPAAVRLVDVFDAAKVEGSVPPAATDARPTEWRFADTAAPGSRAAPASHSASASHSAPASGAAPANRGWEAGPGIAGLAVRAGALTGRSTSDHPILHVQRPGENPDQLHAIEVRLRVSAGANLSVVTRAGDTVDLAQEAAMARRLPWTATTPIVAGEGAKTYTIVPPAPVTGARIKHVLVRPTDVAGADFAIESVRLVFRNEHLARVPSGVSWQGLRDVFRETLVTRAPETVRFRVEVPSRPILDLSIGTPEAEPVTFRVSARRGDRSAELMTSTVTTPHRWERRVLDLRAFAGESVELSLAATAGKTGTLAFWGAPAVRQRLERRAGDPPQVVILMQGDTLRADHLDAYGYERPTAPVLRRLAEEGVLFRHAITQTGWTKAATPSVMASLYPTTHGVHDIPDRLPASVTTIAEVYRQAGYATLSFSSVAFTGQLTNLHQGFEELHESESTAGRAGPRGSKTAREYVDRFLEWLDGHRDLPVFVYLHFFDPHSPYEPNPPFDTMWADPKGREGYLRQQEALKKAVSDAFLAQRGMATPAELAKAGIDAEAFLRYSKDWYDGSIRGMDTELGRLVERLRDLGLAQRTALAFYADHGEEFHEHGRMWHGQTVYGEMIRVPLILWAPGRLPSGRREDEPVELVNVMPTLLEMSGLPEPKGVQGQSMQPLLRGRPGDGVVAAAASWQRRPLVAEKQPMNDSEFPNAAQSYAIIEGRWKLVHNVKRPKEKAEFELFDFYADPLDRKDLAASYPEEVRRLAAALAEWKKRAEAARPKPEQEEAKMSAEQLEQLRNLGYVR